MSSGSSILEFVITGSHRFDQLLKARNAHAVTRRKDGAIVQIELAEHGDDWRKPARQGNPRKDVTRAETDQNPRGVWTFKQQKAAA